MNFTIYQSYLAPLIFAISISTLNGQNDLLEDQEFFTQQLVEFDNWLSATNLSLIIKTEKLEIYPDHLSLILKSNFKTDDSLKSAWELLQEQYDNTDIEQVGERIFENFAFLFDINPDSVSIIINGNEQKDSLIRIYHENYLRIEENFTKSLASGIIDISFKDIDIEHYSQENQ